MSGIPSSHRALTAVAEPKGYKFVDKALPTVGDDDVLVKVRAVALNPTDWKHVHLGWLKDGNSTGSDFAGDVVKVGSNAEAKGVKVGDAVAGYTRGGGIDPSNGAFQEYVKSRAESVWHIPLDKVSYEQAAPMGGIALSTAIQALGQRLNLPTPWHPVQDPVSTKCVLIWAGSTSVGIYAIKLVKLAGLTVVTTASPRNHELLKKLGADAVFDYNDNDAPKKIKEWSKGGIVDAFDTISEYGSTELCAKAMSDQGGKLVTLLPGDATTIGNVKIEPILIYSALDPKNAADFQYMTEWNQRLPEYATELNVMPLKKWSGGMNALPEALDFLKAGKASAEKISINFEQ